MAAVSEDMGKLSGNESVSLSPDLMEESSKGQDLKKAAKALLTELEELLTVLVEAQAGGSPVVSTKGVDVSVSKKSDVQQLVELLKGIVSGKVPSSKLLDVITKITELLGSGSEGVKKVMAVVAKILEESGVKSQIEGYLKLAKEYTGKLEEGLRSGEVTADELAENENVQAFFAGLSGEEMPVSSSAKGKGLGATSKPSSKTSGSSSKTTSGKGKEDYKEAIFDLAMTIQSLLSDIMNGQSEQNKLMSESSKTQGDNAKTLLATKIQDMIKEISQQAAAGKKPWWMYLIAAVLVVVGAIISAFTAGIAAAVVAVVIGAIMASPLGDMMTQALVKAMVGDNPSDSDKAWATAAAIAIITVVTTILSCGAAGFSGAAEGAGEGLLEGAGDEAASETGNALTAIASDSEAAADNSLEEGSSAFVSQTAKKLLAKAEEQTAELIGNLENEAAGGAADGVGGAGENAAGTATKKALTFGEKLTKGLPGRAVGSFIQGFVGGGGLLNMIEGGMLSDPKLKKWMESETGMWVMAAVAAVLAITGAVGGGKIAEGGFKIRTKALEEAAMKDLTLVVSKGVKIAAYTTMGVALAAQSGGSIYKGYQYIALAETEANLGSISAQSTLADTDQQTLTKMQKNISDSSSQQEKGLQNALSGLLDTMDVEGKNQEAALTS